ncbi:MAG: hypothetical protein P1V35_14775, partial [Planctomycetota bacterium]|nr:hypothetical protein [Planctomycetota bacterium]
VGWLGLVSFVGTDELFGANRVGHAVLKEAVEVAKETKIQEASLLQMHAEGLREASRPRGSGRAA